ncbi:MAG TPA: DNA recombination protein RmuC [Candidatus Magasanikbacteria bacterium]|nr:DNA recombination protein RmuC [Candidatus Magasanikbacteria bacterium]
MLQYLLVFLLVAIFLAIIYLIFKFQSKNGPEDTTALLLLQKQLEGMQNLIDQKINDTNKNFLESQNNINKTVQSQFAQSLKTVTEVTEKLTKLDETNKQIVGFAEQLESLESILTNPKQRGILGEYFLENVLKNVLPPESFQMQYKFKDDDIVDAVVFVKDKIIPIDSKFSLENYNKAVAEKDPAAREILENTFKSDLKKRIDETSKYIKPKEGTMDFAFMFIPSEGIYYDLLINQVGALKTNTNSLIEYAFKEKHVIIVSPTSFLAYLQTVMQGLRALKIEETAKEIRNRVEDLGKHLLAFDEYYKKIGTQLSTVVGTYNTGYKEFNKIDKDIVKITGGEKGIEPILIDKPNLEE